MDMRRRRSEGLPGAQLSFVPANDIEAKKLEAFKRQLTALFERAERAGQDATETFEIGALEAHEIWSKTDGNRAIKATVEPILADILAGRWRCLDAGIGFIEGRVFHNGHHRMLAWMRARGVYGRINITVNMPPDVVRVTDRNLTPKSNVDVAKMEFKVEISKSEASRINAYIGMVDKFNKSGRVPYERFTAARELTQTALGNLQELMPSSKYAAPVWGALIYGYQAFPDQTLEFALHLSKPNATGVASSARLLHVALLTENTAGIVNSRNIAVLTLTALRAYVEGRDLERFSIHFVKDESKRPTKTREYETIFAWFKARRRVAE